MYASSGHVFPASLVSHQRFCSLSVVSKISHHFSNRLRKLPYGLLERKDTIVEERLQQQLSENATRNRDALARHREDRVWEFLTMKRTDNESIKQNVPR